MSSTLSSAVGCIRLTACTEPCPQVLARILGLLARQWIVPLSVHACRDGDAMYIAITLEPDVLDELGSEILLRKVEATVVVREARLVRHDRYRPFAMPG